MESICYHHQQVSKWQRNKNGQDSSVPCSDPLEHEDTQVYGTILLKELTNQAMLESNAYKTYYAFSSGEKTPKPKIKSKAKVAKFDKKKQPVKKPKAKGLTVLSEVALTKAEQLKLATKRSKTQFHSSYVSGSGDGVDTQSKVPDEQHLETTGADEGTGTIPGVPDDDKQESDDTNDDDEETDSDRTESDRINIHVLDQSTTEFYEEEEEEKIDDKETMDEEDDEVTKEMYDDVNVNLENKDTEMINAGQGASKQQNVSEESGFEQEEDAYVTFTPVLDTQKADELVQSSSVSSYFTSKLLNLENPSPADNEIASLMETSARHATAVPEITSATTSFPSLLNFSSVFRFNDRVTNLEKDLSEIKQVYQYAQALFSIPAIVDRYMDNKLGEAINKAIQAHNLDCRQEAQDEKNAYIDLVNTSMRALIKEEVNTQLSQILPQAVSDFANPVIEKNITESVEVVVLARSSSQPTSTYEVATSLSEFELTKILINKMEKNKSYDKADYKKKLYDALVESYNTDKDLFNSYGKVFSLKRGRDDTNKDRDPSDGSDRETKRRKSSKDVVSSRNSRSKEKKSSRTSKDASQYQHKSSGKSAHAEEPSHTVEDSGM
ncbi:hypothetical protein Tco_0295074 [Tanacetum coccineum]